MAFRAAAAKRWRSMLIDSTGQNRSFSSHAAPTTTRKYATTASATMHAHEPPHHQKPIGDWAPIMMMGGFLVAVLAIGAHSAWQQLAYSPAVHLRKKKRETLPEVYTPDAVLGSSDKFINKSFLRKVAHIQDTKPTLVDPSRPDPFTYSRKIQTPPK